MALEQRVGEHDSSVRIRWVDRKGLPQGLDGARGFSEAEMTGAKKQQRRKKSRLPLKEGSAFDNRFPKQARFVLRDDQVDA